MKKIVYAALLLLCMSIIGCQKEEPKPDPKPDPIKVTSVSLNPTSLTLTEGEAKEIVATISPSNADNKKIVWATSNSSIATVNEGKVTAIKAGTASITATTDDGGKTATCQVEVKSKTIAVESVSLDKTSLELTEGDEATLVATVKPDNASNKSVEWSSSNETVATVKDGKVTATKAGTAKITVQTVDGGKTAECSITINAKTYPVESISLDKSTVELTEGEEVTLVATIKPDNATNKDVEWTSSDESVATVKDGKVTAVKAGTTIITVKTVDGGKTATCNVTVSSVKYPLIKKITSNRGVRVSLYYDQDDRIIRLSSEYEGEGIIKYDNYVEGNGVINLADVSLVYMENGLAISWEGFKYSYSGNHMIKWEIPEIGEYFEYNWSGDIMTSSLYFYDNSPHDFIYEYYSIDNPFSDQQFNMTCFLQENFSMNILNVLGFCGAEPGKLLKKDNYGLRTTQYEYYEENGVITKIIANRQSNSEVYSIEYY